MENTAILLISCPDAKGITAKITEFIFLRGGNIVHADQHIDDQTNTFFMRVEWERAGDSGSKEELVGSFLALATEYKMHWELFCSSHKPKIALFVSKHLHCLYDLLARYRAGDFKCEVSCIISNHQDAQHAAESFGIDFYHIPVLAENKVEAEQQQLNLLKERNVEVVVLARYMQVLSSEFLKEYPNNVINIHHSFLPAFKGANPYLRAHEKGVKIIGATSHYVSDELDMGPIIEQDTVRVSHRDTIDDKKKKGQDLEKMVLSRALTWHLERKILTYNNKTVIFD